MGETGVFAPGVPGALHRQVGGTPSRASHAVGRSAALLKFAPPEFPDFGLRRETRPSHRVVPPLLRAL